MEQLLRGQQHAPRKEAAASVRSAEIVAAADISPLRMPLDLLARYRYLRQDGSKVWIEGNADRSTPVEALVKRHGEEGDAGYLRGAHQVVNAPASDFLSEAAFLSFSETGLPLTVVAPRYKVGLSSFAVPAEPGAFAPTSPTDCIDLLFYDWSERGYVPCAFHVNGGHHRDPGPLFLSHSAVIRLHYAAFLLGRMFAEHKQQQHARVAYLLVAGYLSNDRRIVAYRIEYDPKKYLSDPFPGRQPMLRSFE